MEVQGSIIICSFLGTTHVRTISNAVSSKFTVIVAVRIDVRGHPYDCSCSHKRLLRFPFVRVTVLPVM